MKNVGLNSDQLNTELESRVLAGDNTVTLSLAPGDSISGKIGGGDGADTITGSDSSEILEGGAGDDVLDGGGSGDAFWYEGDYDMDGNPIAPDIGNDTINNFQSGTDVINFNIAKKHRPEYGRPHIDRCK